MRPLRLALCVAAVVLLNLPRSAAEHAEVDDDDDGRDLHRISADHLDLLHREASKHPLDELSFMVTID